MVAGRTDTYPDARTQRRRQSERHAPPASPVPQTCPHACLQPCTDTQPKRKPPHTDTDRQSRTNVMQKDCTTTPSPSSRRSRKKKRDSCGSLCCPSPQASVLIYMPTESKRVYTREGMYVQQSEATQDAVTYEEIYIYKHAARKLSLPPFRFSTHERVLSFHTAS